MITVEDFNNILKEFGGCNIYHCINTGLIDMDSDYSGVLYDFAELSKTYSNNNYTFTFKIVNNAWTGGYWITNSNGEWLDVNGSYNNANKTITVITTEPNIKLHLYISNIATSFKFEKLHWIVITPTQIKKVYESTNTRIKTFEALVQVLNPNYNILSKTIKLYSSDNSSQSIANITGTSIENVYLVTPSFIPYTSIWVLFDGSIQNSKNNLIYFERTIENSPIIFKLNKTSLTLGKINHINFIKSIIERGVDSGVVYFENNEIPFNFGEGFDLDLINYTKNSADFEIKLNPKNNFFGWNYNFKLDCQYLEVKNVNELISECEIGGVNVVDLGSDLFLSDNLLVKHYIIIKGEEHSINLNGNSIILSDGVKVTFDNINFVNGDTTIVQSKNTDLTLNNCTFTNCQSTKYDNLGSCIYCDIDANSLEIVDEFKTILNNCIFIDNHNCILHGGQLIVNNCKLHNTDTEYLEEFNSAFLYQMDGNANIYNSIFDIDYTSDNLCSNHLSVGFAQCIVRCGLSAYINGVNATTLSNNNSLPFFKYPYNNQSHIFCKYYYPQIDACVFTSPTFTNEDKSICYCVTDKDFVFKENVQITRAELESENNVRKIEW